MKKRAYNVLNTTHTKNYTTKVSLIEIFFFAIKLNSVIIFIVREYSYGKEEKEKRNKKKF